MKAKDLAKLLGVSPATVSLVLNGKPGISDSLRAQLTEKILDLGYGSMLKGREAPETEATDRGRPAIVYLSYLDCEVWDQAYAFFPGVLEGAEMEARSRGWNLLVYHMNGETDAPVEELLRRGGNVIGVIVQSQMTTPELAETAKRLSIPLVTMDCYDPRLDLSSVNVDNRQSMYAVVHYLKDRGHREIGYVGNDLGEDYQIDRHFSFRRALQELGLPDREEFLFLAGTEKGPYEFQKLAAVLGRAERLPTALVAESDRAAMRTVNALKQLGYRVPEDVSVIGFDNNPLCEVCVPRLTSVRNSRHLMGRECVMLLQNLRKLQEEGLPTTRLKYRLPTQLVCRDSVADGPLKD